MLNPVDDEGRFRKEIPVLGGKGVKEADPVVLEKLEDRGSGNEYKLHDNPDKWEEDHRPADAFDADADTVGDLSDVTGSTD